MSDCETCVITGGCTDNPYLSHMQWLITTQLREGSDLRRLVVERLNDEGISVTEERICVAGLANKHPKADDEWLLATTSVLHHTIGWEATQELSEQRAERLKNE